MSKAILEGVPKIGYGIHLCPFPGSIFSIMQYLNDPVDYDLLMGVSGAAFRRIWNRDDGGNVDLMYLAPEPYNRISDAIGYPLTLIPKEKSAMLAALRESIARERPLIAFGVIGPPEAGLVTGYDRDGDVLYGYSYFQDASIQGYHEQSGWLDNLDSAPWASFMVVGDRVPGFVPQWRGILVSSLKWAIDLAHTVIRPNLPNHVCGLAAYDAWADALDVDADYPHGDIGTLATRVMIHGDQCVMQEERHSAAGFLRIMARRVPEVAGPLNRAADLYDLVAEAKTWLWGFEMGPEAQAGLANTATRREIAAEVRRARKLETEAVRLLERALNQIC